jgi:hypothetical protein
MLEPAAAGVKRYEAGYDAIWPPSTTIVAPVM